MAFRTEMLLSLLVFACSFTLMGASVSLGLVKSPSDFRVDGSLVRSNATVFDGTLVETAKARAEILLNGGASISLAPDSRARIQRGVIILERGQSLVRRAETISAGTLKISPASAQSALRVAMNSNGHVQVAAQEGEAEVRNAVGVVVARVSPGAAVDLDPRAGADPNFVMVTGCVERKNGRYVVTDSTAHVMVELQGKDIDKNTGKRVQATGPMIPGALSAVGASQIVQFTDLKAQGSCNDRGPVAYALIGGTAVAGTVIGLTSAGVFDGPSVSAP